jgi:hypothetical protein
MARYAVPSAGSKLKVSTPVPDILYGYRDGAFQMQQSQLISMGTEPIANSAGLVCPFLVVEFKGDGGSMWVATNQCLGRGQGRGNAFVGLPRCLVSSSPEDSNQIPRKDVSSTRGRERWLRMSGKVTLLPFKLS